MFDSDDIVKVLWTGGWDSTFRLLDLVLVRDARVQPFYVLDTARRSSIIELETMQRIRRSIAAISPAKAQLVSPSTIVSIHDIAPDPEVTARYLRLKARSFLGSQYDWLARFVTQFNLEGVELCVEAYTSPRGAYPFLKGNVEWVEAPNGRSHWRVREQHWESDLSLFAPFRFPLLSVWKADMARIADERGFSHIMEQTWFCLTPVRNKPCGICNPCQSAVKEGMGRRLPHAARIRHFLLPVSGPFTRMYDKVARLAAASW